MNSKLLKKIRNNLQKIKSPEGFLYASSEKYQALFGRDSLISSWQMLGIDNSVAKNTLKILAKYQGKRYSQRREEERGKILHEYRKDKKEISKSDLSPEVKKIIIKYWDYPYYGSIDSTPLFIIIASFYYQETKDKDLLKSLMPNIQRALGWTESRLKKDKHGFLSYQRLNPHGLFHQGWKDRLYDSLKIKPPVALVEVQGYVYKAFKEASWLYKEISKNEFKFNIYNQKAEEFKKRFNVNFWLPQEKFYAFALDGKGRKIKSITSNVGQCLFTGIIDNKYLSLVIKRLFKKDIFTPYGIRTLSLKDKNFKEDGYHWGTVWPHDNWIIYQGLLKNRYRKEALLVRETILRAYKELKSIPECYIVTKKGKIRLLKRADKLQAWSIGSLYNFLINYDKI